ncbi:hypothetical protein B0H17DRAFT_374746 [Mycena rosella]|uniref:Uncharacterized protein n=1 Tax=Mycena rosella TaxID=1033263 RepID=A0AAD7CP73_MYCRO|nr:hypothetical protein B0H17DRAFT_374746 [Mycena rosella]
MMIILPTFLGLATAAGLAVAAPAIAARADLPNSSSCVAAIGSILNSSDPAFGCLQPNSLRAVLNPTAAANTVATVYAGIVGTWLNDMCSVGSCSTATLSQVATQISAGCGGTKLANISIPSGAGLLAALTTGYPVIRESMCLVNTTTKTFCLADTITALGNATADAATPPADALVAGLILQTLTGGGCTECSKAAFQVNSKAFQISNTVGIQATCDANFLAGLNNPPVGVSHNATTSQFTTTGKKNGAGTLSAPTLGLLFVALFFGLL